MLGSDVLDIAIGMVFVFLALSLVCSAANEGIEAVLKNRAVKLEQGIRELLGDPSNTTGFVKELYNHGLINSLFMGQYEDNKKGNLPSYIPARSFALAVMDLVKRPPVTSPPSGNVPVTIELPRNLEAALKVFTESAGADLAKLQENLEDWYNNSMDRVSGWYKRRAQAILFVLGLVVTVVINADTINIGRALSNDASLRKGLVAVAEARAIRPLDGSAGMTSEQKIKEDLASLNGLQIPLGWPDTPKDIQALAWSQQFPYWLDNTRTHAFGWILTAIAISFGAPFWFDLLNRFVALRSSKKPVKEESGDGAAKKK
jgi:hypothetical protein